MSFVNEKILNQIRHYCNYRERCHEDVRYKLVELGARGAEVEQLISIMIGENLLNEERYARSYVRGKFRINGWGRKKIQLHLKAKKVSDYCIRKGMQEIEDMEYEKLLHHLANEKFAALKKERHTGTGKQKVIRFLLQRGFEYDLAADAVNRL